MSNYMRRALEEVNPCGAEIGRGGEWRRIGYCRYSAECAELGNETGGFLCVSKTGYQVAGYLEKGSNIGTERMDLVRFVYGEMGRIVVDPGDIKWKPKKIDGSNVERIIDEIISRGQEIYSSANSRARQMNPLNFDCSAEDVVRDLF